MISIYHKVNTHCEVSHDLASLNTLKSENILWIDLLGWDEETEKAIEKHLGLEIMNIKESVAIEQSSRYIEYADHVVSHSNFVTRQGITLIPKIVAFTLEKNLIITNRDYDFRSFLETSKKVLTSSQPLTSSDIFLNIIDLRIANDADIVEDLTRDISELSKAIINQKQTSKLLILKLNALRENLMLMMQNCIDKKLLISDIKKSPYLTPKTDHELNISVKDVESVIDFIRFNFDRLDNTDSTLNNLITYEQNHSIKLFTIVSLFFMPPMLIASIYGMNFEHMPELKWQYGYPLAIVIMGLTVIITTIYFIRKKWL